MRRYAVVSIVMLVIVLAGIAEWVHLVFWPIGVKGSGAFTFSCGGAEHAEKDRERCGPGH